MTNLRSRILLVIGLLLASAWSLFPRTVVERNRNKDGQFVYDTVRRVPLKRGLDLQGGMHLALEVDDARGAVANCSEAIDRALTVVRKRIDEFGTQEPLVQKEGECRMIVELPGIDDPQRAQDIVQKSAFLQFQITDKTGALDKVLPRIDAILRERGTALAGLAPGAGGDAASKAALQGLFTGDSGTTKGGKDSTGKGIAASTPADPKGGPFSKLLATGQTPGEFLVVMADVPRVTTFLAVPEVAAALPPGKVLRWGVDSSGYGTLWYRSLYVLDARPIITGEYLRDAKPNTVPVEGTVVEFTLDNEGGRRFKSETAKHIKDFMAIVLDDKVTGRPPVIQSAIGTRGQITMGNRDLQAAQDLALVLRAGALPVPLKVVDVRTVSASLGEDSIQKGIVAGVIAVLLIVVIMVGYYRFSGALAVAALLCYVVYTMAVLAGFNAVLTLPGIAGMVLSIGIAVDANVLIFERIREELDRSKTVRLAIEEGFKHATSAIVDTSAATILTAAVLYQYGTGPVRGFAVTLIAGIVASVFTAIFVTKTFYLIWLNRSAGTAETLSI
ncbi:MAG: protein translocase subunit SecD [Gemmatimonadetes bacterium]|nr:protein translocase subunit SecD [Gemmatimonadota bacterium]